MKKSWNTPELIVIKRANHADQVLMSCKIASESTGSASSNEGCLVGEGVCSPCESLFDS